VPAESAIIFETIAAAGIIIYLEQALSSTIAVVVIGITCEHGLDVDAWPCLF
jgi:hypothetical protein